MSIPSLLIPNKSAIVDALNKELIDTISGKIPTNDLLLRVKELIDKGANKFYYTFAQTCKWNHLDVAKYIAEQYIDKQYSYDKDQFMIRVILTKACEYDWIDLAKRLIDLGANNLNECLSIACKHDNVNIITLLIEHKADDFKSALLSCLEANTYNTNIVEFLIKHVNAIQLVSLFEEACLQGDLLKVRHIYYNVRQTHNAIEEGISFACKRNHVEVIEFLLTNHGREITLFIEGLALACLKKHEDIIHAIINYACEHGRFELFKKCYYPVSHACLSGDQDIIAFMIDHYMQHAANNKKLLRICIKAAIRVANLPLIQKLISIITAMGFSRDFVEDCMCAAALNNHVDLLKYFLSVFNITNQHVFNASLYYACRRGHLNAIEYILSLDQVDRVVINNEFIYCLRNEAFHPGGKKSKYRAEILLAFLKLELNLYQPQLGKRDTVDILNLNLKHNLNLNIVNQHTESIIRDRSYRQILLESTITDLKIKDYDKNLTWIMLDYVAYE